MKTKLVQITLLIFLCSKNVYSNNVHLSKNIILYDLPTHKDLWDYVSALERIINFWSQNRIKLDLNSVFGLFLVNVNLRPFIIDDFLPNSLEYRLKNLLAKNDEIQQFYTLQLKNDWTRDSLKHKISLQLFTETTWSKRLIKFDINLLKHDSPDIEYPEWDSYARDVDNIDAMVPSPKLSDKCIALLLTDNEENRLQYPRGCSVPKECYFSLIFGNNIGYALTHRLLFLHIARFSRDCIMFTTKMDENMRRSYCEIIYKEAEYIANNGFLVADLMFEQMALCSLDGHAQFLRKSWISELMKYQSPSGCFYENLNTNKLEPNSEGTYLNGTCNGHVTSVAAATLAASIRFVLENY